MQHTAADGGAYLDRRRGGGPRGGGGLGQFGLGLPQGALGGGHLAGSGGLAHLSAFQVLRRDGAGGEHLLDAAELALGEFVRSTRLFQQGRGGIFPGGGECAVAGVERRGRHRVDDGDQGLIRHDLRTRLVRDAAQLTRDGGGNHVTLLDACLALLADRGPQRAEGGAGGLDEGGFRTQAKAHHDDQGGAQGIGQPAEAAGTGTGGQGGSHEGKVRVKEKKAAPETGAMTGLGVLGGELHNLAPAHSGALRAPIRSSCLSLRRTTSAENTEAAATTMRAKA